MPSRRRLSTPSGLVTKRRSESTSVTTRLISSGIVRSKLRSPASTWASGRCAFEATIAAARVEFTSPYTTTSAGPRASNTRSSATMIAAVCVAWLPDPTPRSMSGRGSPSSSKNTPDSAVS